MAVAGHNDEMRADSAFLTDQADNVFLLHQRYFSSAHGLAHQYQPLPAVPDRVPAFDVQQQPAYSRGNVLDVIGAGLEAVVVHVLKDMRELLSRCLHRPRCVDILIDDHILDFAEKLRIAQHDAVFTVQVRPRLVLVNDGSLAAVKLFYLFGRRCRCKIETLYFAVHVVDIVLLYLNLFFPVHIDRPHHYSRRNANTFHAVHLCL